MTAFLVGFLWFLLDAVLCFIPAILFAVIPLLLFGGIVSILQIFVNVFKLQFLEVVISRIDTYSEHSKIGYVFFWLGWLFCVWLSTEIEGFPYPALIGG